MAIDINFSLDEAKQPGGDDSALSNLFDEYSAAMDAGDYESAEAVLNQHPDLSRQFRTQLHGLYLLEKGLRDQAGDPQTVKRRLGDYDLGAEIGRGGMGIVYSAVQRSLQRPVALKVLPFAAMLDPRQIARFRNEALAAASLHHPHIVSVYGFGCEQGVYYYSMQLIDGQSLDGFLADLRSPQPTGAAPIPAMASTKKGGQTLPNIRSRNFIQKILEIGAGAATALHYAHQQGIVHRDIKPSNLLLDQTGQVFVTDFGLARHSDQVGLTTQGERIGTYRYMSPEQASGRAHEVDYRTDIFSLGVTLYELLTLKAPFEADKREDLFYQIENSEPPSIRSINPAVPTEVETIVQKAMAKSPQDRYRSAQELANDLLLAFAGKPVLARRPSPLERGRRWLMKHQRTFLVGLSVLVAAAITATVLAVIWNGLWQRERQASEHAKFFLIQANKTVERFSSLLDDRRVDDLPTSIRQRVLKESIAYYEDFVRFTSSQPELNHQKGVALAKLARLRELGGDYRGAEQAYRMAVEELAAVAEVTTDPSVRFDHAKTLNWLGLLLKRRGRLDEAESITRHAIRELEPLQGLLPAQPKWLATQAMATANMAELMSAKGMTDAARQQYELALELLEKSQASKLADFDLQSAYHKIEGNYLTLLMELDPDRAENRLIETIENLEAVNQLINDPDEKQPLSGQELAAEELRQENRDFIADLRNNLAVLLCQRNRPEQGFVEAQLAINYWREQFEKGERYFKAAEHYATALNTAGEACWLLASNENLEEVEKEKKLVDADNFFQQAETLLVKALENEDHRPELKSRLASIRHNRGSLCASREDWETAKGHFQSAIELQRQARDQQPEHTTFQLRLEAHEQALEAIKKYFSEATNL